MSEHDRLPILLSAAPYAEFPERLLVTLRKVLSAIGIPEGDIAEELRHMRPAILEKTASRSILGSLKQMTIDLEGEYEMGRFASGSLVEMLDRGAEEGARSR